MSLRRLALWTTALALALWCGAQIFLALTLRVEGFDGYWYLGNAWRLAGGFMSQYETTKAPLLSLLVLPVYLLRRAGLPEPMVFAAAHLVSVGLSLTVGLLLGRLLASRVGPLLGWAAAVAFLGSRTVFRYGAFSMADLPATLTVLLSLELIRRHTGRQGLAARFPFALSVALAVLARYPSVLVVAPALLWDAVQVRRSGVESVLRRTGQHLVALALAGAATLALHLAIYVRAFGSVKAALAAALDMVERNARLGGISVRGGEPWWEYGPALALSCSLPVLALMAAGAVAAWRRGGATEALHGGWALLHLGFISFVSSHKEARYLLPALPSLYLFAAWGAAAAARTFSSGRSTLALLLAGCGLLGMVREGRMLAQPFFREPQMETVAKTIGAAGDRLAWSGQYYPLTPPRFIFTLQDEYYYVYHLAPHVMEYYLERPVEDLRAVPSRLVDGVVVPVGTAAVLGSGDALVLSVPDVTVTAWLARESLPPLKVAPTRAWDLVPDGAGRFLVAGGSHQARLITSEERGSLVEVQGPPGLTEVLARRQDGALFSLGVLGLADGSGEVALADAVSPDQVRGIRLLRLSPQPVAGTGRMVE